MAFTRPAVRAYEPNALYAIYETYATRAHAPLGPNAGHRTELLKQWQQRLQACLGVGKDVIGTIGGGKAEPSGKIDIAVMQSLSRQGEIAELVHNYGHVIVDECHHLSALSFERS